MDPFKVCRHRIVLPADLLDGLDEIDPDGCVEDMLRWLEHGSEDRNEVLEIVRSERKGEKMERRSKADWDRWFLEMARHMATASKDPSTKVGCVIVDTQRSVLSTGYNGLPRGVADTEARLTDRSLKYKLVVHAEENALLHAARLGVSLQGGILYSTWPLCSRCAVSAIQAGISRVCYPAGLDIPDRWRDDFDLAVGVLCEASVVVDAVQR